MSVTVKTSPLESVDVEGTCGDCKRWSEIEIVQPEVIANDGRPLRMGGCREIAEDPESEADSVRWSDEYLCHFTPSRFKAGVA